MHPETTEGTSVPAPRRTVVLTGLGATTALGGDVTTTWEAMLRGESGVRLVDGDLWEGMPPMIAGTAAVDPAAGLAPLQRRRLGRCAQFAVTAAAEAWRDAGLEGTDTAGERVAVSVSTATGDLGAVIDVWETLKQKGWDRVPPLAVPTSMANSPAAAVSLLVGARSGVHSSVNACSSGTQALATGADLIRRGLADIVVAGGAEAPVHPVVVSAFAAMRALSKRVDDPTSAPSPFDAGRDGMVLGEGSGIVILESEEHARARGARVYAELAGVGISSDAYHVVQPDPNGVGDAEAIRLSLADAGVAPEEVAHFNANGTATLPGDAAEALAVREVFGEHAKRLPLTANKSLIGHSLGGSGAIESIATVLAVHHGVVPPTRNFRRCDDGIELDVVQGTPRKLVGEQIVAVKNSAGFGGHNVALTFRGVTPPEVG
jgi:3-oxoacyl-[acyl-carrier-protein] synthase II